MKRICSVSPMDCRGNLMLKINEVARLTGITVRTLHYYDQIGLLKPAQLTESGYRLYDDADLAQLQQILFFRELDFPLKDIKEIMNNPAYDKEDALRKQEELLVQKRERLNALIELVGRVRKGEEKPSFEAFDESLIAARKAEYTREIKERWGKTTAYKESKEKTKDFKAAQWTAFNAGMVQIIKKFADRRQQDPASAPVQELVKQWQKYITDNFYTCTDDILEGLGLMYVGDERFRQNIDQCGEGTAKLMSEAIAAHCRK